MCNALGGQLVIIQVLYICLQQGGFFAASKEMAMSLTETKVMVVRQRVYRLGKSNNYRDWLVTPVMIISAARGAAKELQDCYICKPRQS